MQREVAPPGNLAPRGKAPRGGGRVPGTGGVVATLGVPVLGVAVLGALGMGVVLVVRGAERGARVRGAGVGALGDLGSPGRGPVSGRPGGTGAIA